MQTSFSLAQLADPAIKEADGILRACVHCGFCTATCPTYVLLGDELDSPRGRIYLIKDMLENDRPASVEVTTHVDRCLSCLSCMTTCPSGVHYMHLVDHARRHIERTYARPPFQRLLRALVGWLLPHPRRFRLALVGALLARPFAALMPAALRPMLALAPRSLPSPSPVDRPQVFPADGTRRRRVALLSGCAQPVLAPEINEATVRLLTRHGCEVVIAPGGGCCGALTHHLGQEDAAHRAVKANVAAWWRETVEGGGAGLDAIVINASGCGTTIKDYGFMLRGEPAWAERAARVSALARDVTELMTELGLGTVAHASGLRVTYHSACSMQHGQKLKEPPKRLLSAAGYQVAEPAEGHLCCGSAGTYNLFQPDLATQLRDRKLAHLHATAPQVIAAGNIGCITQLAQGTDLPVVHTVELLDWATGGPRPAALAARAAP